jgi:hypothetical protein
MVRKKWVKLVVQHRILLDVATYTCPHMTVVGTMSPKAGKTCSHLCTEGVLALLQGPRGRCGAPSFPEELREWWLTFPEWEALWGVSAEGLNFTW